MVFAGGSSAVPGQPSIATYPSPDVNGCVGSIVFAVYDTARDSSRILYAKVDSLRLVLDTIATSGTLSESLPCVSLASTTVLATWQNGDSVKVASLQYGPDDWNTPGGWSTGSVIDSGAFHPMSTFSDGILSVIWASQEKADTFAVFTKTCPTSGNTFGLWSSATDQTKEHVHKKTNPVVAGCGVSVWQESTGNKWAIRGSVRGDTVNIVADNDGSYHPHAIAESSGTGPSVNTVSVKLLYTEGTAFEVDSGVYDTGVTKYVVKDYPVSNAATAATQYNNGCKLMNKGRIRFYACRLRGR